MLIALSPSKALNFTSGPPDAAISQPQMADQIAELSKTTAKLRPIDLKRMMGISDALAKLNRERFQAFDPGSEEGIQAAFAFNGDVYLGLKARTLDKKSLTWAQDHVRILSGLYGVLRPLDVIQPYRLEMGVRLKTKRGATLYDFWGARIAEQLNVEAARHKDKTLVNLASQEYFGGVDRAALTLPVIGARFLEEKDGEARMLSFFAKKARGLMARWMIDNRIDRAADLKGFDAEGYRFSKDLSGEAELTFTRPQPPPVAQVRAAAKRLQEA